MRRLLCRAVLALWPLAPALGAACEARDFLAEPLPTGPGGVEVASVLHAYPDLRHDAAAGRLVAPDGRHAAMAPRSSLGPAAALAAASFGDQFRHVYPLAFDLSARDAPWFDPGRLRDAAFFALLYPGGEGAARAGLRTVPAPGSEAVFRVTGRHGVDCQLAAALEETGGRPAALFEEVGGGFAWRTVAGTDRLSVHSYGAAIDLNPALGGYWRWSGRPAGNAGPFDNRVPATLVRAFERRGFVWGGKWHHFDGMHFEYRPELIVHARLMAAPPAEE